MSCLCREFYFLQKKRAGFSSNSLIFIERETGVEPATLSLGEAKARTIAELAKSAYDLFGNFNAYSEIEVLNRLPEIMVTEHQFAQLAEIAITYSPKLSASERPRVCTSKDAESIFRSVWQQPINHRESFYALFLDRGNKVLGYFLVSIGGISGTVIDPRLIFQVALKANASAIIVANYHPSGNSEPGETYLFLIIFI